MLTVDEMNEDEVVEFCVVDGVMVLALTTKVMGLQVPGAGSPLLIAQSGCLTEKSLEQKMKSYITPLLLVTDSVLELTSWKKLLMAPGGTSWLYLVGMTGAVF